MRHSKISRMIRGAVAGLTTVVICAACFAAGADTGGGGKPRIGALKGPTAMGLAWLMAAQGDAYEFALAGAPDEMVAMFASGQVDIAALPTNMAAALYNKTNGGARLLALNTLGVLYVLERGDSVRTTADLAGKTLWATGQGGA